MERKIRQIAVFFIILTVGSLLPSSMYVRGSDTLYAPVSSEKIVQNSIEPVYFEHEVKAWHSLEVLAQSYGTSISELRALNGLMSDELVDGTTLLVPTRGEISVSWYGEWFNNKPMANTELYHVDKLVIAHRYLPLGTCVELKNPKLNTSVVATVKDRIAERYAYRWDVSPRVFSEELGMPLGLGVATLQYQVVHCEDHSPIQSLAFND